MTRLTKTPKRATLEERLHQIKQAREWNKPHPVYPGLEHAKLNKAQYKLVHLASKFYFRIYAQNNKVQLCKGLIHPTQICTISEWVWHCDTRKDAQARIKEQIGNLRAEGYTWERKLQDLHELDWDELKKATETAQNVNFAASEEKYQHFENSIDLNT